MDSTTESAPPIWYYAAAKQDSASSSEFDVRGPLEEATIGDLIRGGILSRKTWVMRQGTDDWVSLESSELSKYLIESKNPVNEGYYVIALVKNLVCKWTGLPALEGFHLSYFFADAFRRRSQEEVDQYFGCGCDQTTPALADIKPHWPKPWFFWRMLLFGILALIAFCIGWEEFQNPKMVPGLIMIGAFVVPLTCLTLFFELNILRNVSLLQTLKCVVGGACFSLLATLFINAAPWISDCYKEFGDPVAGLVEEPAKVIAAIFFIRGMRGRQWILNGMLVGAAVGTGFAGFETAGYIYDANNGQAYDVLLARALFAPFGHIVWTASIMGALCRAKGDAPFRLAMLINKGFLRVFSFVVMLHMLWNTGLAFSSLHWRAKELLWAVSIFGSWYLVLLLIQEGLQQIRNSQNTSGTYRPMSQ